MKLVTNKLNAFLIVTAISGCGKSNKDEPSEVESIPNVCKALAVMGTFPTNEKPHVQTYGIACFEGYLMRFEDKSYPSTLKCGEAKSAASSGDEMALKHYEPIDSKVCPSLDAITVCEMPTAKTFVYKGSEEFFKQDAFDAYCKENGGQTVFISP